MTISRSVGAAARVGLALAPGLTASGSARAQTPTQAPDARELVVSRATARPARVAPAEHFMGTVRVQPLFDTTATTRDAAGDSARPSRAQQLMGDVAPKLAELTDSVLFGNAWARPGLSRRDRSLVTVRALIAMNRPDQLRSHLALAREHGVTQVEAVEAITHLAFYAGWPSTVTAVSVAREVFTGAGR